MVIMYPLFILFWLAYLAFSIWLARYLNRGARLAGRKFKHPGRVAFALMWGVVFWDWPFQTWEYQMLCRREAGLTVFKTPEQWDAENGGVLKSGSFAPDNRYAILGEDHVRKWMNERFYYEYKINKKKWGIEEWVYEVYDGDKNEVLLKFVNFKVYVERSFPQVFRFWNEREGCGMVVDELLLFQKKWKVFSGSKIEVAK